MKTSGTLVPEGQARLAVKLIVTSVPLAMGLPLALTVTTPAVSAARAAAGAGVGQAGGVVADAEGGGGRRVAVGREDDGDADRLVVPHDKGVVDAQQRVVEHVDDELLLDVLPAPPSVLRTRM